MLFYLLGAGVAGWLAGESLRRGRRVFRGLGITAEEYARGLQEFRTLHQPPPSGTPAPYRSCLPSYADREAREALCRVLEAMEGAPGGEQVIYQGEFAKRWNALTQGQKDCMEGWLKDACPRAVPHLLALRQQLAPLPPPGEPTPTRPTLPRGEPFEQPLYAEIEIPTEGVDRRIFLVPPAGPAVPTIESQPEYGYYGQPREFQAPIPPSGTQVPTGALRAAERGLQVATEAGGISMAPAQRPRQTISVPFGVPGGGIAFTGV